MISGGYTVEVIGLSAGVTEDDVRDFFAHCGFVEHVEIIRSAEYASTAYVTFKDAYAMDTAIMLSGAQIVDKTVHISRWGSYVDECDDPWDVHSWMAANQSQSNVRQCSHYASTPGEAVFVAQEVVMTMLSKGYTLSKDALFKARELDECYGVTASAGAKVLELSNRIGLTDKINAIRMADERYRVSEVTGRAAMATGRTAAAAATAVVNSSYFAKGALWVSDALSRAAKVAADLGTRVDRT